MPRLQASAANQVWSWDITYLPTTESGIWLYLFLVTEVWNCRMVSLDVHEREDPSVQMIWSVEIASESGSARAGTSRCFSMRKWQRQVCGHA